MVTRRARLSQNRVGVQRLLGLHSAAARTRARGSVSAARAPAVLHAPDSLSFRLAKIMGVLPRRKLEWGETLSACSRRVPRN